MAAASLDPFQRAFAQALMQPWAPADPLLAPLLAQPGFAVYRNTALRGCIDALQANYPAVARLVGDPWFRAAAAQYVRAHWPAQPMLVDYGDAFPGFLARFAPAAALPYLPAVAALDRAWTEAHLAADAPPLAAAALAAAARRCAPTALALAPHPAARWRWSADAPALTLWQRNRDDAASDGSPGDALDWHAEGALLTRPQGAVQVQALPRAGIALLDACAAGLPLGVALEHAADAAGDAAAPAALLARLIEAGAFRALPPAD